MDPPRPRRTRQTFSIPHKHEPEPSSTHTPNQRKKPGQIEEETLDRTLVKTRPWHRRAQIDAKRRGAGNKTLREKKKRPETPPQAATNLRHVSETNRVEENLAEEECRQQQRWRPHLLRQRHLMSERDREPGSLELKQCNHLWQNPQRGRKKKKKSANRDQTTKPPSGKR